VSPLDSATTLPAGGHYREFSQIDQPWSRNTNLTSLDLSYDAGFATVSSTSSYYTTSGSTLEDNTYSLGGLIDGGYLPYYAGTPRTRVLSTTRYSPIRRTPSRKRFASCRRPHLTMLSTTSWALSTRIRRVKGMEHRRPWDTGAAGRAGMFDDYVDLPGGAFYIATAPGDVTFQQIDNQKFTDKSVFGELTWHFMPGGQLTVGGRHFSQEFTDAQSYDDYPFPTHLPATPHESPASKTVWKIDPSFEYAKDQFVYALWSQGFRRGGANSVPWRGHSQKAR